MDLMEVVHGIPVFLWLILLGVAFFYLCACCIEYIENRDKE